MGIRVLNYLDDVPGKMNLGADMLSRGKVAPGDWALHPQTVQRIWVVFGKAEVDLFALEDNSHCPTFFLIQRDCMHFLLSP